MSSAPPADPRPPAARRDAELGAADLLLAGLLRRLLGALDRLADDLLTALDGLVAELLGLVLDLIGHRTDLLVLHLCRWGHQAGDEADRGRADCEAEWVLLGHADRLASTLLHVAGVGRGT